MQNEELKREGNGLHFKTGHSIFKIHYFFPDFPFYSLFLI